MFSLDVQISIRRININYKATQILFIIRKVYFLVDKISLLEIVSAEFENVTDFN
jgi:hypothetical protein